MRFLVVGFEIPNIGQIVIRFNISFDIFSIIYLFKEVVDHGRLDIQLIFD